MSLVQLIGPGKSRALGRVETVFVYALCTAVAALFVAIAFGWYVNQMIGLYIFLGAILSVAFLTTTGNPQRPRTRTVFSTVAAILSLLICGYFVWMHPVYEQRIPMIDELTPLDQVAAVTLILLVLEATRRCIGFTLVAVVLVFLSYAAFGSHLEGAFSHRGMSLEETLTQLVFTPNGIFGSALEVAAFLVFVFVAFGALLDRAGGGDFFFDVANSLVGRQVGGPAKVAVVSSGLYGSISGSPTSDVVTTGSFTIPLMIRTGLTRNYAAAVEATASTGGALLPPVMGSAAFLMSDFTGISYGTIALAAIFPAFLYYLAIYLAVDFRSRLEGAVLSEAGSTVPRVLEVLKGGWYYLIPVGLLVYCVLMLNRPALSGALAFAALVPILIWRNRRQPVKAVTGFGDALNEAMRRMTGIGVACAVAGLVVGTLAVTDLTGKISSALFALAAGNYLLTLLIATVVTIVLGMGMPTPAVYTLAAVLAAPALLALDVPLLPAHLFIVYFASMSAITPPVAVAAFAAASIADTDPIRVGFLCCRLALVAFVIPFVFITDPSLLLMGSPGAIAVGMLSPLAGVIALVAALEGYLTRPIAKGMRMGLGLAGAALITTNLVAISLGAVLLVGLLVLHFLGRDGTAVAARSHAR